MGIEQRIKEHDELIDVLRRRFGYPKEGAGVVDWANWEQSTGAQNTIIYGLLLEQKKSLESMSWKLNVVFAVAATFAALYFYRFVF